MYKPLFKILMAASVTFALGACKPSQEQIIASANTVYSVNKQIDSVYQMLYNSFDTYDPQTMDHAFEALKSGLLKAEADIKEMKAVDECTELKDVIINKIAVMKDLAGKECSEQLRIYKIDDDQFNDNLRQEWDGYAASAEKKKKAADKAVADAFNKITKQK